MDLLLHRPGSLNLGNQGGLHVASARRMIQGVRLFPFLSLLLTSGCATVALLRGPHRYTQAELARIRTDATARFPCAEARLRVTPERYVESICDGEPDREWEVVRVEGCGKWLYYGDSKGSLTPRESEAVDAAHTTPWIQDGPYPRAFDSHAHTPEEVERIRQAAALRFPCEAEALTVSRRLLSLGGKEPEVRGFSPGPHEEVLVMGCGKWQLYTFHAGQVVPNAGMTWNDLEHLPRNVRVSPAAP